MTVTIYEFSAAVQSPGGVESAGFRPHYETQLSLQYEADSLEVARAKADAAVEEMATDIVAEWIMEWEEAGEGYPPVPRKIASRRFLQANIEEGRDFFADLIEPHIGDVVDIVVQLDGVTVAGVAVFGGDPGEWYCPEHGRQRSWTYREGKRYCRECDTRLVDIRERLE